jgi:hypothetical protein
MMDFGGSGGAITLYYRNAAHVVNMPPLSRRFVNAPLLRPTSSGHQPIALRQVTAAK